MINIEKLKSLIIKQRLWGLTIPDKPMSPKQRYRKRD